MDSCIDDMMAVACLSLVFGLMLGLFIAAIVDGKGLKDYSGFRTLPPPRPKTLILNKKRDEK